MSGRAGKAKPSPASWTIPKLRAELVRRGIAFPIRAKKTVLERILRDNDQSRMTTRLNGARRSRDTGAGSRSVDYSNTIDTNDAADDVDGSMPQSNVTWSMGTEHRLDVMQTNMLALVESVGKLTKTVTELSNVTTSTTDSTRDPGALPTTSDVAARGAAGFSGTRPLVPGIRGDSRTEIHPGGVPSPRDVIDASFSDENIVGSSGFPRWRGLPQEHEDVTTSGSATTTTVAMAPAISPHQALLGRGVPSHSVPRVALVSPQLRGDILRGKDVNLAALLIPGFGTESELSQREIFISGSEAIPIKPRKDYRLTKSLTLPEFIKAFSTYRTVMTEGYPHRKEELDIYFNDVIEMASDFSGTIFYEYHKMFSARAAALLLNHGIKVDWSVRDNELYCKLFAGRRANACTLCSSMAHATDFCPLSTGPRGMKRNNVAATSRSDNTDIQGRPRKFHAGTEVCNNFNTPKGCTRYMCKFAHICSTCKSGEHSLPECSRQKVSKNSGAESNTKKSGPSTKN